MRLSVGLQNKLSQCDKCQQQLWAYRPLSDDTLKSLREYYRVGLTYTSNALEGNSLTESETKVIIIDRIIMTQMDILRLFRETQPVPEAIPFEALLLQTITRHPGLNAPTLAKRLGRSLRTTQRYLKILTEKQQIVFQGVAKKGGYVAV